jgi:hypothetical protein
MAARRKMTREQALRGAIEWLEEMTSTHRRADGVVELPPGYVREVRADLVAYRHALTGVAPEGGLQAAMERELARWNEAGRAG